MRNSRLLTFVAVTAVEMLLRKHGACEGIRDATRITMALVAHVPHDQ